MARRKKRAKGKRWICPNSDCPNHTRGIIAPIKPRKDDIRRYCLRCSEASGRLVERVCPSRVKAAEKRTQRRATAAQRAIERKAEAAGQYPEVLRRSFRAWLTLDAWEYSLKECPPGLRIRKSRKAGSSGYASPNKWHLTLTAGVDRAWGYTILLHELAHFAVFRHGGQQDNHGPLWKTLYHAAAQEITGDPVTVEGRITIAALNEAVARAFRLWLSNEGGNDDQR